MIGRCALTGSTGPFVRSHLLPRAFTDKVLGKPGRIEFGSSGQRPTLKYTSWFDSALVTADGERLLSDYDNAAAAELQCLGLTWRHFPVSADAKRHEIVDSFEYIEIASQKTRELRMFFLSLLWRFVATKLPKFREIRIDVAARERLRKIVAREIAPHPHDFPAVLVLMTTVGQPQVQAPLRDKMRVPPLGSFAGDRLKIFRFFLDGLIVHMSRKPFDAELFKVWAPRVVGNGNKLCIIGRSYEGSFQQMNVAALQDQVERQWPDDARRIYGAI